MSNNVLKIIGKIAFPSLLAFACTFFALPVGAVTEAPAKEQGEAAPGNEDAALPGKKPQATAPGKAADEAPLLGDYLAGRFAESEGDAANGIKYLRDLLKHDPENKDALRNLYRMLVFKGKIEEAIPLAEKLGKVKDADNGDELPPAMLLAVAEAKDGQYDLADEHIADVPKTGFKSLQIPLMRAWFKLGMGEVKEPMDVRSMTPNNQVILPHVYLNAAFINDIAGFGDEARKQYESAVKDTRIEPFRAVEALANFYTRKGMSEKREKLVADYLSAHGDSYLADELLLEPESGQPVRLVSDARQGLAEVFYTVANIFHGARAPADEIAILHLALYLRPDFPAAQFLLASAYELAQDYPSAVDAYKAIRTNSPYHMRGRIRAAYDETELGHKDAALAQLDTIARESPKDIDALLAKGDILRAEKHYQDAIEVYTAALARVGTPVKRHWIVYFSRGACYQIINQWGKAEADMKSALALSPAEPEILNYLGYSWLTMGQNVPQAKKMVEQAYDARPEDAHIIDSMGYALYVTGDFASAEEYFDQALERTPNDPTVNDHLGDTYWQLGRKTEARYQWERALADGPDEETEKGLHKKLKEGLALLHAEPSAQDGKKISPPLPPVEE